MVSLITRSVRAHWLLGTIGVLLALVAAFDAGMYVKVKDLNPQIIINTPAQPAPIVNVAQQSPLSQATATATPLVDYYDKGPDSSALIAPVLGGHKFSLTKAETYQTGGFSVQLAPIQLGSGVGNTDTVWANLTISGQQVMNLSHAKVQLFSDASLDTNSYVGSAVFRAHYPGDTWEAEIINIPAKYETIYFKIVPDK